MVKIVKEYAPYIALIAICFLWFQDCSNKKSKISDLKTELSIDSLDFIMLNKKVAAQDVKIISDRKTMKKLVKRVEGLRKINAQVKATTHTKIVEVPVQSEGEVKIKRDTIYVDSIPSIDHYLKLPQWYHTNPDNEWYKVAYHIDTTGQSMIDSALFVSMPTISFGVKDKGMLKNIFTSSEYVVAYEDKNPYTQVKGLENLQYKPRKKWYQKKGVWFATGFVGGAITIIRIAK